MTSYKVMEEWVRQHPSVETWIKRLKPATRPNFMSYAYHYFNWVWENGGEFAGKSPEELLDLQDGMVGRDQFKQVALLQAWLDQQRGRLGSKKTRRSAIRSFYNHNHVPLPEDVTYKMQGDRPAVSGTLTWEDFKKILLSCNTLYQGVFMCMFQGALGEHEFEYFNNESWEQIEPQLKRGKERLKIFIPGRKHKWMAEQNYYTFVGRDGVECLKRYLKEERGTIRKGEPVFLGEKGDPLTDKALRAYFHRHAVKVGVIKKYSPPCPKCGGETVTKRVRLKGQPQRIYYVCREGDHRSLPKDVELDRGVRYGVSPHELRDLFRSEWELSPAKTVCAEFFMGHRIDPNDYNKIMKLHPDWAEEQYSLAEPFLNIMSEDPRKVSASRVNQLQKELEEERRIREALVAEYERQLGDMRKQLNEYIELSLSREERESIKELLELVKKKKIELPESEA